MLLTLVLASRAQAQPRPIPSLRLASGVGSTDLVPDRDPGFVGHLNLGIALAFYQSATDHGALVDTLVDAIVPPRTAGVIVRGGVGYDRMGPGGGASRDFSVSSEIGYGYSIFQGSLGVAYLTGRASGERARGVRTSMFLGVEYGLVFLEVSADFWPGVAPHRRDVSVLLGVDVLVFGWLMGIGQH